MTQALSARRLAAFYPTLLCVMQRLQRRWQTHAQMGTALDVVDEFKRLTVDVTTLLAFGHDVNTIEHDHDSLQKHLEVIFPAINRRLTAAFPYWRFCRMPADWRTDRSIREIRARLREIIAEARRRIDREAQLRQSPTNLLEAMLLATDEAGKPFSDELILGNSLQVLVAGEDTTAATLAWAVHLLCDQPAAVAALRQELDLVLGRSLLPADVEMAGRLSRVDATLQETLRLRSVAPLVFLESTSDVAMNGVTVPRGTWIIVLTRLAATSSAHRPREFLPERWLEPEQELDEAGRRASLPFGGGARVCPGRALALLEMRLALAVLYGSFDVERVGSADRVGERYAFIVEPVALQVKLRPR
jgi:cytochrome P450